MARIFAPEDFGAVALALLFVNSSSLFVSLGMGPAIVHSDLDRHKVTFHAFTISTLSSVAITIFGLANSEWLATVLGNPEIEPILQVLLLDLIIRAWILVPMAVLEKDLRFGPIYTSNMVSRVVYLGVAIVLGVLGFGVWSLVIANLANSISVLIMIWWAAPNRDWLKPVRWDWSVVKSLMNYGSRITASSMTAFVGNNIDDFIVGRRLGTYSLGLYTKAYDFTIGQVKSYGGSVVGQVFFPVYTTIRENEARLRRAYLKSVRLVSTLMFPIAFGFLVTADLLIPIIIGDQWVPMVPAFQVFCLLILARPISANTTSVFRAVGKPQNNMYAGMVRIIAIVPLVLLLIPYDIMGVAAGVTIADYIVMVFAMFQINRLLPGSAKDTLVTSLPALGSALIMFAATVATRYYLDDVFNNDIWLLIITIIVGVAVYGAVLLIFQREFTIDLILTSIKSFDSKGRLKRFTAKSKPVS